MSQEPTVIAPLPVPDAEGIYTFPDGLIRCGNNDYRPWCR